MAMRRESSDAVSDFPPGSDETEAPVERGFPDVADDQRRLRLAKVNRDTLHTMEIVRDTIFASLASYASKLSYVR